MTLLPSFLLFLMCHVIITEQQKQKCGLPSNINELPDYAQEELKDIWAKWRTGTSCEKEILVQNDILSVLSSLDASDSSNTSGGSPKSVSATERSSTNIDYPEAEDITLLRPDKQRPLVPEPSRRPSSPPTDYDQTTFDDVAMMQFNNANANFLRTASPEVKREFEKIWTDDNIPSENLRSLKIQTLAVSLLNSKQLEEYNGWATKRRKVLRAREQEMRPLSNAAKRALRKMSRTRREEVSVHPLVKLELRDFVEKLNRRRNKVLVQ